MRKIRNGKLYDTDTAQLMTESCDIDTDGVWCDIKLFCKKNGEFFAVTGDLNEHLVTFASEDEAKLWCENYLTADAYIRAFGEVSE